MEEKIEGSLEKKIRFRQPGKVLFNEHSDDGECMKPKQQKCPSLLSFIKVEVTRDYQLDIEEERFSAGREKFYSFMKIPKEVEIFMFYGVLHCIDSFLYIFTFLPLRVIFALYSLVTRPFHRCFGLTDHQNRRILTSTEICDLLKAIILVACTTVLWLVDTNMMYHLIKSQSVIKLYIFFNMLDIGDKLMISLGQDAIDTLLWTATEPKGRKREHLGVIPHLFLGIVYVMMHSILILFQATTLNVAMNASNKGLLTIMMSNNFVELKGSVFKKFDKNNLFQVSCSDIRERFHLVILLSIVILQTLKQYNWKMEILWQLMFDSFWVLCAELLVDWIKHAFITRFNELHIEVYKDYRTSLAYDLSQKLQKHAFSGHSDLVARRMGFIPLPLVVVMARVFFASVNLHNIPAVIIFFVGYVCLWSWKILNSVIVFGKACSIIAQHKLERTTQNSPVNAADTKEKFRSIATSPQHLVSEQPRKVVFKNGFASLEVNERVDLDLGASAIFANSTVDLKDASLNEELLKINGEDIRIESLASDEFVTTRSEPDIKKQLGDEESVYTKTEADTLKKSESEPSLINLATDGQGKEL